MLHPAIVNGVTIPKNMERIPSERCACMFPQKGRGRRPIRKEGTVVGAYMYPFQNPGHMYHTYHIVFDDQTCMTLPWRDVQFLR